MIDARAQIEQVVATQDLRRLLELTGMLHGHFCPFVALGVRAGVRALKELGVRPTGMEEVVAIVETNNCFSDGVQFVTGCSFGNNGLIYRDYGKTAFTLAKRSGEAVRISARLDRRFLEERKPEATRLFDTVVRRREGTEADQARLKELWSELSFSMLQVEDDRLYDVEHVTVQVPSYARIFASVTCSICGEEVMESRVRMKEGKPVCLPCSGQEYYQLTGDGISTAPAKTVQAGS